MKVPQIPLFPSVIKNFENILHIEVIIFQFFTIDDISFIRSKSLFFIYIDYIL